MLAVGRLRPPFVDDLAHYEKLLGAHTRLELVELREDAKLAGRIPDRSYVVQLDSGGHQLSSEGLAEWLEQRRQAGLDVCFVLGGAYGIELGRSDHRLSLGPMTLPHQLARVVLLEQLFRAHKILAGEPYHH